MAILKKPVFKQAIEGEQERSEILSIPNKYKNILEDLIDSLNIERLAIPKQINLPSNDISTSDPEVDNNLLNRP